ncbi:hypothetical protein HUG17_3133 [Dermatophagoides farinae]|uniref:CCHC-type domain-containing protein n=1 Tax=Dermatophagoides farinae TaxID=6954 RepID=A0A9D4SFH5_DERFA|nr:hypothetical protein HUG17_3133 [Dermatophagoides farinae]
MGPSCHSATPKITVLTDSSFQRWNVEIESALRSLDLWKYVEEKYDDKSQDKEMYAAKNLLYSSLDDDNHDRIIGCKTAKEIYKALKEYHQGSSSAELDNLMLKFYSITWSDCAKDTFRKIRSVASELLTKGKELTDGEKCSKVLSILPPKFESIKNSIEAIRLSSGTRMTFNQLEQFVTGSMTAEAGEKKEIEIKRESETKNMLAMARRKKNFRCYECHKEGHIRKNCPLLKDSNESNDSKPKVTLMALSKAGIADRPKVMPKPSYDDDYQFCEIFADGGASVHTFNDRKYFTDIEPYNGGEIASPGGISQASGIGSVEVELHDGENWTTVELTNSLLIETSPMNMISLGQLSKHRNIHFGGDFNCTVIYRDGKPLIYADRSQKYTNVYEFGRAARKHNHVDARTILSMANKSLVGGLPTKLNNDMGFCRSCCNGKLIESCHPSVLSKKHDKAGEYIHMDIGGSVGEMLIKYDNKFDDHSKPVVLVGYDGESIYRRYDRKAGQMELSSTVKWEETPSSKIVSPILMIEPTNPSVPGTSEKSDKPDDNPISDIDDDADDINQTGEINDKPRGRPIGSKNKQHVLDPDKLASLRPRKILGLAVAGSAPNSFNDARNCVEANKWKESMQSEYQALIENDTWDLVPRPENKTVISVNRVDTETYVGIQYLRDRPNRQVYLSQPKYALAKLKAFGMENCHVVRSPGSTDDLYDESPENNDYPYRQAIGSLLHRAIKSIGISFEIETYRYKISHGQTIDTGEYY